MRPFGPLPGTSSSGTPSSRANLRTEGDACGSLPVGAAGWCAGIADAAVTGAADGAAAVGAAEGVSVAAAVAGACATEGAAPAASSTRIGVPSDTLSPTLTFNSFTTPACEDGISIDALSLSTVIRLCSTFTVSPGLTNSSITATSLKSPMSGTTTVTAPPPAEGAGGGAAVVGAGTAAAAGAGAGAVAAAAPSASSSRISEPSLTLSPSATFSSLITP